MAIPPEHRDHPAADAPAHVPGHARGAGIGDATAQQVTRRARAVRALAWLSLLLTLSGCALLAEKEPSLGDSTTASTTGERPGGEPPAPPPKTEGLEIEAPSQLRTLLLRNLDLARLASMTGAEAPDETEWLRLVAAAPAQVRELLETEGYFHPEVQVRRDRGPPPVVHLRVVPGPRARVDEVALSVQGVLRERTDAGDEEARATIQALHEWWPLPPGDVFRNPDWTSAKSGALGRLRAAGYASPSVVTSAAHVDADSNRVQLTLTLDSG